MVYHIFVNAETKTGKRRKVKILNLLRSINEKRRRNREKKDM